MTLQLDIEPTSTAQTDIASRPVMLPRGIRAEANGMTWENLIAEYGATTAGPVRLGHWECTDVERAASRLGPQARNYQATIAVGDRIATSRTAASGPVAALTEMLHERGIFVEMLTFHQIRSGDELATFIHGTNGIRSEWAIGLSEDSTQSALRAIIACANRLAG